MSRFSFEIVEERKGEEKDVDDAYMKGRMREKGRFGMIIGG